MLVEAGWSFFKTGIEYVGGSIEKIFFVSKLNNRWREYCLMLKNV
jgi:hypothetical protein